MAHSSGFSITGLTLIASGSGFAEDDEYDLIALDPGQGSGFTGQALTDGDGKVSSLSLGAGGSNYSSGSWSYQPTGSAITTVQNDSEYNFIYGATTIYTNTNAEFTNKKIGFYDGWGYFQVLTYTGISGPSRTGVTGWKTFPPEVSQSAQYTAYNGTHPVVANGSSLYNVERSKSREPGSFTTIAIVDAPGSGSIIVPTIGYANSVSINSINVEMGVTGNTDNSDIHDLYQAFNTVARTSKKNFDWYGVGPIYQTNSPHPIRFDEFFSTDFDAYGGSGCFSIDTPITLPDRSEIKIEDLYIGQEVLAITLPTMPLDFDDEETWKDWETNTIEGTEQTTATVKEIYFDWYEDYYVINDRIKTTYEHPFFVKRDSKYTFETTADLQLGDEFLTDTSGSFVFEEITSIEKIDEELETVNINCEPHDVYFAGGVLVHNVHDK